MNLHEAQQGALRTKQHARLTIYWPGLYDNVILNYQQCQDHLSRNVKEPIIQKSQPARPFQEIAVDLCSNTGHDYLIMVDCHTDWPDIIPMTHNTTVSQITTALRQAFCRTAIPDVLWSDGGPQFTSHHFSQFARQWSFIHKTSSPHYPQSNGKIELTVKSMKKLIYTAWNGRSLDHNRFCRAFSNTEILLPARTGYPQPKNYVYGHPVQDSLPVHRRSFLQEWQHKADVAEQQVEATQQSSAKYYNQHAHPLTEISIGSNVAIQNPRKSLWDTYGVIIAI